MKKLAFLLLTIFIIACTSSATDEDQVRDTAKKEIIEKTKELFYLHTNEEAESKLKEKQWNFDLLVSSSFFSKKGLKKQEKEAEKKKEEKKKEENKKEEQKEKEKKEKEKKCGTAF